MNVLTVEHSIKKYSVGMTLLAGLPLFTLLPLGLDFFLPAMYQIGEYFNSQTVPPMAISLYMLFWGVGQLFWGGVADRFGKKNIALVGLLFYTLASYMISVSQPESPALFLGFRALQSFSGSACYTAIFALIRTRFEGDDLNKSYSYLNGILAFIPVSSPLVGAYILENNPWLYLFSLMAILGAISLIWIAFSIPTEHKAESGSTGTEAEQPILKRYWTVAANVRFRSYLFFAVTGQMLFIYYLTVAPTYLIGKLGISQVDFGKMFMIIAIVFMVISFVAPKLGKWLSIKAIIGMALLLCATGGLIMFALSETNTWYAFILPMVLIAIGCTILLSCCPANALVDFRHIAGVASGLYTSATFGLGSLISAVFINLLDSADLSRVSMVYTLCAAFALVVLVCNKTIGQDSE